MLNLNVNTGNTMIETGLENNNENMKLSVEVVGDASLPPLLLIHGFLTSNLQWALNEEALAKHFQLFKLELWGHGKSPMPTDNRFYSIDEYLIQIEKVREQYGIKTWSLLGQSFGAGVALNYEAKFPSRCHAVIVTNSNSAFSSNYVNTAPAQVEKMGGIEKLLAQKGVRGLPVHPIHSTRIEKALKDKMVKVADAIPLSAVFGHLNMLGSLSIDTKARPVSCPSLLINGTFEKSFQAVVASLKMDWPALAVKDLPGGHSVNLDCSEAFNIEVLNWLEFQSD